LTVTVSDAGSFFDFVLERVAVAVGVFRDGAFLAVGEAFAGGAAWRVEPKTGRTTTSSA
jgi:hypothetical protein